MHTMGLITIAHGERSRVKALNASAVLGQVDAVAQLLLSAEPGALAHLKEARRMFEAGMVRLAAEKAVPADVADLRPFWRISATVLAMRGPLSRPTSPSTPGLPR
jgi:DNA-binding FadR family transcriptional regulator